MIIKRITLSNVRSYASPEPIEIGPGVTLFEGDIGSGKSSILSAIEFALFGLGEMDGPYLLRHGARNGSVLLEFEVSGKDYKVYRSLVRKRSNVTQKDGYIVEDGAKTEYSVTEMKSRILKILSFNEIPRPKTSSLIFRYAVFTPQEMMKEVLFQPVERRLETLRRAFNIEDYSIVNNNASFLIGRLENESRVLKGLAGDVLEKRSLLKTEQDRVADDRRALARISEDFAALKKKRQQAAMDIEALQAKKERVLNLGSQIPGLKEALDEKIAALEENGERLKRLAGELSGIEGAEKLLITLGPLHEEFLAVKTRLEKLEPSSTEIQRLDSTKGQLVIAIEKEKTHLEKAINELQGELETDIEAIQKEKVFCERLAGGLSEIDGAEKLLSTLSPLHEEYLAVKAKVDQLDPRIEEIQELANKKSQLLIAIEKEKTHLENAIKELQGELETDREAIRKEKSVVSEIVELAETEKRLIKETDELPSVSEMLTALRQECSAARQDTKNEKDLAKELKDELRDLKKIGIGAPCPKCKQKLTMEHYSKVEQDYLDKIHEHEQKISDLSLRIEVIDAKIKENVTRESVIKASEKELNKLREEMAKLKQKEETLKQNEERIDRKLRLLEESQKLLNQEAYAKKEREQLLQAITKLDELAPLETEYGNVKARLKALEKAKVEEQHLKVTQKLGKLKAEQAKLKQKEENLKQDQEKLVKKQGLLEEKQKLLGKEGYATKEREQLAQAIKRLEELSPLGKEYDGAKARLKVLEKMKVEEQHVAATQKLAKKGEVTTELEEKRKKAGLLDDEIRTKKELIEQKQREYDQEKPVLLKVKDLEGAREKLDTELQDKNGELVGKKKDIQRSEAEIKRISGEIQTKESQLLKLAELNQYQTWLSELFIPAVKVIETNVMASINNEFNLLFQKWLGHLLEAGDVAVRVDENFTPLIEQEGYEMDVESLSGGEKTSVALAYRLALNVMVKTVCEAMQSNLLILDEPTDGFSREQLFRLRDILNELKCEQVIIVSHEKELEGFVDKIYHVTKENGESKILAA